MGDSIPLVDIADISLHRKEEELDADILRKVGNEMKNAFSAFGFCYLTNHGINQEAIDKCMSASFDYFKLSSEEKTKVKCGTVHNLPYMGWIDIEAEAVNRARPGDYREGFLYHPRLDDLDLLPSDFQKANQELFSKCLTLALRVCDALSLSLNIDKTILRDSLKSVREKNNCTSLRSSHYPPIRGEATLKKNQIRCGEHSDYGTLTFLFQDDYGGLEVKSSNDEYIAVPPIRGTIVANIGDLLQRWTADELIATKHRVVVPEDELQRNKARKSLAFFVVPDDDCLVECVDRSDKYKPIICSEYLASMMY